MKNSSFGHSAAVDLLKDWNSLRKLKLSGILALIPHVRVSFFQSIDVFIPGLLLVCVADVVFSLWCIFVVVVIAHIISFVS